MTARQEMQARVMRAKNLLRGQGCASKRKAIAGRIGSDPVPVLPKNSNGFIWGWHAVHLENRPSVGPPRGWKGGTRGTRNKIK